MSDEENVIMSDPFRFMVWKGPFNRFVNRPIRQGKELELPYWRPDGVRVDAPDDSLVPATNLWIYALPVQTFGGNPLSGEGHTLSGIDLELFATADGSLTANTKLDAELGLRPMPSALEPAFAGSKGDQLRLPTFLGHDKVRFDFRWCFVGSPERLSLTAIRRLRDRTAFLTIPVELALRTAPHRFNSDPGERLYKHSTQGLVAGVLDLSRVGPTLNQRFRRRRADLIGYTRPHDGQEPAERDRAVARQKKRILAQMLKEVLDAGDPGQLRDHLRRVDPSNKQSRTAAEAFLLEYDEQTKVLTEGSEGAAADVAHWSEEPLFRDVLLQTWQEQKQHSTLIDHLAACYEQLWDSVAGRAMLAKHLQDPKHLVHTFILPPSPTHEEVFKAAQKSVPAVIALWLEYAKAHMQLHKEIHGPAKGLNNISRETLLEVTTLKSGIQTAATTKGYKAIQFNTFQLKAAEPDKWAKWALVAEKDLGRLLVAFEVVNLYVSIETLKKAEPGLATGKELLSVLGSLATTYSAFTALRKTQSGISHAAAEVLEKRAKFASGVGAVIDVVCGAYDAVQLARRDDYSAMAGNVVAAIGSALVAAGCFCAVAGVGTAPTIIGLPLAASLELVGAILVGIGTIVVVFTTDSDAQQFAAHCAFGEDSDSRSSVSQPWTLGTFASWENDFDKQITVLFNIIAGFTFESVDHATFRLLYGFTRPQSVMKLNVKMEFNNATLDPKLELRFDGNKLTQVGGRKARLTPTFKTIDGRNVVEIRVELIESIGAAQTLEARVQAQLLIDGTSQPIPASGKFVDHVWFKFERGNFIRGQPTESKDF